MKTYLRPFTALLIAGGMMLMVGGGEAADVAVSIVGVIVIPPCTVNNGEGINVDLGDIPVTALSGGINAGFQKLTSVPVSCTYYRGTPYVKVTGTQLSGGGANVLATNVSNFGIALYQGGGTGTAMVLGNGQSGGGGYIGSPVQSGLTGVNQASGQFTFTAVPYQVGSAQLAAGGFTASANMSIRYQ